MNKLLTPIKYSLLAIVTIGTVFALSDQYMYHGAAVAISAGVLLSVIEDFEYANGYYDSTTLPLSIRSSSNIYD